MDELLELYNFFIEMLTVLTVQEAFNQPGSHED